MQLESLLVILAEAPRARNKVAPGTQVVIRELCRSERNGIDIESYFALSVLSYSRECTRGVVLAALALAPGYLIPRLWRSGFQFLSTAL